MGPAKARIDLNIANEYGAEKPRQAEIDHLLFCCLLFCVIEWALPVEVPQIISKPKVLSASCQLRRNKWKMNVQLCADDRFVAMRLDQRIRDYKVLCMRHICVYTSDGPSFRWCRGLHYFNKLNQPHLPHTHITHSHTWIPLCKWVFCAMYCVLL